MDQVLTGSRSPGDLALWIVGPERAELRPATVDEPEAGELVLRALASGISRGTEGLVFRGEVPESEHGRMRGPLQEGDFPFPVKYGYALVGLVEAGPAEMIGQRAFALHPHQSRLRVPAAAALPVPAAVSTERAVLAPQMETALNATWDAGVRIGDRIAVVGAGVIGCLVGYLCAQIPGAEVVLIDPNPGRAGTAAALGVGFAAPGAPEIEGCDLVFHASGSAEGLDLALTLCGFEGSVIELSWYGTKAAPIHLGGAFHSQRLSVKGSQVGSVAPERRARWDHRRRLALALSLCADPRLDDLVQAQTPFADIPARLAEILRAPDTLCHLIRY